MRFRQAFEITIISSFIEHGTPRNPGNTSSILINRFTFYQPFERPIAPMMEHSFSLRLFQGGLLVALAFACFVDVSEPLTRFDVSFQNDLSAVGSNMQRRHEAALHNAYARLDQTFDDGVENARAADLAIKNLDCWETELKTNGETPRADACRQGFESAMAAIVTPKFEMQANLNLIEP